MKRKDSKGRILRTNEYERQDGRYVYRYLDSKNKPCFVYSWRLIESDVQPKGKPYCDSLRELEKQIIKDTVDEIVKSNVTLNNRWEDYIANKLNLKQSTRTNYIYMYDKFVRNDVGNLMIRSVNYSVMKKFFNKLLREFQPDSLDVINTILNPVFTIAVRDNVIRQNPMTGIMAEIKRNNTRTQNKRHALTEVQQTKLLEFVKNHAVYDHWHSLIVCMLGTGCRIGEMLGLRWQDVDWTNNIISVNHSLLYRQQDDGKVKFRISSTKTKNGVRDIPMFSTVRESLKKEFKKQEKNGFCTSIVDDTSGFIWMNKFGNVLTPAGFNGGLKRIRNEYNKQEIINAKNESRKPELLPSFSAHHLRHTFCVRLCENETDIKLIQEIMGHSDIATTMDVYNESNIERKKERFAILEKISSAF